MLPDGTIGASSAARAPSRPCGRRACRCSPRARRCCCASRPRATPAGDRPPAGHAARRQPVPVRRDAGDLPRAGGPRARSWPCTASARSPRRWPTLAPASGSRCVAGDRRSPGRRRGRGRRLARPRRGARRSRPPCGAGVPYVGLVASRKRGEAVLPPSTSTTPSGPAVHTPAGLDIGARTPREVALSILAEIVRPAGPPPVRRRVHDGAPVRVRPRPDPSRSTPCAAWRWSRSTRRCTSTTTAPATGSAGRAACGRSPPTRRVPGGPSADR